MTFSLWIETEHVAEPITDFCNVIVHFPSGTQWALNVWTFDFFAEARNAPSLAVSPELAHQCMLPPDLFVTDLSRDTLERVIGDLIDNGNAPQHWRSHFSLDELSIGYAVRVVDECAQAEIAGKLGQLSGIARDPESDAVTSYAVWIHDVETMWWVDPADLELA